MKFLAQVGVHSAKFTNERSSPNVLSAVQRYNITHPVVNDVTLKMWEYLGIRCWPSLVMLGSLNIYIFSYLVYKIYFKVMCNYKSLFQDPKVSHWLFLKVKVIEMKCFCTRK